MTQSRKQSESSTMPWVQHPHAVKAQLEVVEPAHGTGRYQVQTSQANGSGIRVVCDERLPDGAKVQLSLLAPDGKPLSAGASIVVVQQLASGFEAILVFDCEQPRFEAAHTEVAA